jgi:hypothetical protein
MLLQLILSVACVLVIGCSSIPIVGSLSPQAAEREAKRDIQSGHMKIYLAGTYASTEVGVESRSDRRLIANLPRDQSLSGGCTDPDASAHIAYARAYNRKIVGYLRSHVKT